MRVMSGESILTTAQVHSARTAPAWCMDKARVNFPHPDSSPRRGSINHMKKPRPRGRGDLDRRLGKWAARWKLTFLHSPRCLLDTSVHRTSESL